MLRKRGESLRTVLNSVALALLIVGSCTSYQVAGITTADYKPDATFKKVGIGFFEVSGAGNSARTQRNFYDSIAFALQEKGYHIIDASTTRDFLARAELPADRTLSPHEILQFSGKYSGRILIQGRIQEAKTEKLVESLVQVMIQIHFHDMATGQKLGEIVLFGKNLDFHTAHETMVMAQKAAEKLDELLRIKN